MQSIRQSKTFKTINDKRECTERKSEQTTQIFGYTFFWLYDLYGHRIEINFSCGIYVST